VQELSAVAPLPGCEAGSVEFAQLDLSNLSSVKDFAKRFNKGGRQLDVLVCNAGIMSPPKRMVSEDGLELQFQVSWRGWLCD
jgi:NAD(P)-dependent dehydrogenase (short-subunit alcohol dehydrogenase family)